MNPKRRTEILNSIDPAELGQQSGRHRPPGQAALFLQPQRHPQCNSRLLHHTSRYLAQLRAPEHLNDGAWYAEDSWKVNPRLTVNYGIRWEYYGVQHNKNPNLESNFYLGSGSTLAQQVASGQVATTPNSPVGGLVKKNLNNYAPRIGFAFDPFGNGRWAVRGGYGISYERNFGNVTYNVIQNPPNYSGVTLTSNATTQYRISTTNFGPFAGSGGSVGLPAPSLRALQQNMPTAYTHQYLFSVEHEIATNDLLAIEYSGARGVHQYSIANVNGIGYGTFNGNSGASSATSYGLNRLNHQYGAINIREANGDSHYDSVNVRLKPITSSASVCK